MAQIADGLVCAAIGCLLIFLNKPFAHGYARFQNRLLGFDSGERGVRRGRIVAVFVGVVFVLLGVSLLSSPLVGRF